MVVLCIMSALQSVNEQFFKLHLVKVGAFS